jgi:signal-transduction protein with cAMP-binding, CBS, and nucleotidyltransferase domain
MTSEKESCPLCHALPADWVDDPHRSQDILFLALADLRKVAGCGEAPMLSDLPQLIGDRLHRARIIISALADLHSSEKGRTVFGKGLAEWQHRGRRWLLNEEGD